MDKLSLKSFFPALTLVVICLAVTALPINAAPRGTAPEAPTDNPNTNKTAEKTIQWYPYESGLARADKLDKKILLYFFTNRCFYCKTMGEKTFTNQAIIDYINENFVPIRIEADKHASLALQYKIPGVPISIFMEDDSKMIGAKPGYVPPEAFIKMLQFVNEESYKKE